MTRSPTVTWTNGFFLVRRPKRIVGHHSGTAQLRGRSLAVDESASVDLLKEDGRLRRLKRWRMRSKSSSKPGWRTDLLERFWRRRRWRSEGETTEVLDRPQRRRRHRRLPRLSRRETLAVPNVPENKKNVHHISK